jgi:two-component system, cell cycle response regulator
MDSNPFPTLPPLEPPHAPDVAPVPEPLTAADTEPAAAFGATASTAQAQATAAPNEARLAPEVEPSPSVKQAPATAPNPSVPREAHGAAHVLVVDDGDLALRFISNQLKRYGFQVHVAREPREALAQLQARRYEFVFIEINLETDSNFPVTQAIRQAPLGPGEKAAAVVLLADRHSNSELQAAANAGADAWLTTPLLEADLSKLVGPRLAPRAKAADTELHSAA